MLMFVLLDIQVVKEIAATSRDVSAEDSLYETVKEIKDPPPHLGLPNGTTQLSPDVPPHHPHALLNGHLSPCTPERGPLSSGVEYASIDLKKKSRHSADMESKKRSNNASVPSHRPLEEPEDLPPPVPEKVLDENDNQPVLMNGSAGAGLHNGEVSQTTQQEDPNKQHNRSIPLGSNPDLDHNNVHSEHTEVRFVVPDQRERSRRTKKRGDASPPQLSSAKLAA